MKLSIIIPAYNEENTIETVVNAVKAVSLPKNMEKEIIIVNDGSSDKTAQILAQYANDPIIKIYHQENMGKTAALNEGIKDATGDIILVQDADLEYCPDHYPMLVEPILNGETNVVYGSRFLGTIKDMKFINRFANISSN
ncbi:MAG: glycosyltransferase family 2 protein, partial [Candidatus Omnitrophica bacterium]|nr:glycosyltransferase family 2 protein [Candidatus Omnitrophota bacterium]